MKKGPGFLHPGPLPRSAPLKLRGLEELDAGTLPYGFQFMQLLAQLGRGLLDFLGHLGGDLLDLLAHLGSDLEVDAFSYVSHALPYFPRSFSGGSTLYTPVLRDDSLLATDKTGYWSSPTKPLSFSSHACPQSSH